MRQRARTTPLLLCTLPLALGMLAQALARGQEERRIAQLLGPLAQLLEEGGHVRVRVAEHEVARASEVLSRVTGDGIEVAPEAGASVITVRVKPSRAGEVNRVLAQSGVYASRLEAGNDLEELFLTLTTTGAPPTTASLAGAAVTAAVGSSGASEARQP